MVLLDSDHTKAQVLQELGLGGNLVTAGNYRIVEDTHLNGPPSSFRLWHPLQALSKLSRTSFPRATNSLWTPARKNTD